MRSQKTEVLSLLQQNLFLPEEKREQLQTAVESASSEKLSALTQVLQSGLQQQTKLLHSAFQENPTLFTELKGMIHGEKRAMNISRENTSRAQEEGILSELENELRHIIEK